MKNLLLCTLCFISLVCKAQTATDQNIRITFSSYNSQWQVIVLDVESLSGCDSLFTKFRWPGHADSTIKFHKGYKGQVILPSVGGDVSVQFKTVSKCNVQSNGPWATLSLLALAVGDELTYKKTSEGVALFFSRGEVLKSVDGMHFVSQGTHESVWFDRLPEARNYYRVKSETGKLTPIVYVPFDVSKGEPFKVYNRLGQRIAVTNDISPYRWNSKFIIVK